MTKISKPQIGNHSTIKEICSNPIGHDIVKKLLLQLKMQSKWIENPIVGLIRIGLIRKILRRKVDDGFFEAFFHLLNQEQNPYTGTRAENREKTWWKEAIFYQIYPRSFCDSNKDGIGDLGGVLEKLDYLKELGVDVIWLSPVYDSPNDDNGYDIRDYFNILSEFGTMEQFDCLLRAIHDKGMRLIMDLVVNHTSDEHPWFQMALKDPQSKYRDYYFLRTEQNNWTSFFSGSAWNYYEEQKLYGLHLFSKKQMDLNWENKELREDIKQMIRWWLAKGVDGFRMDVINYISKEENLPDGDKTIGSLMGYYGIEKYFYGPKLHMYLQEIRKEAFEPFQAFSVGEMPGIGQEMGKLLTGKNRRELDMFFSFDHLENPGKVRFDDYSYDLNYLKEYLMDWNQNYSSVCQLSLFYNNHDNPRFISKVTDDCSYHKLIAKLLAVIQFTQKGTPFIFQGDELGMTNSKFQHISDFRDIESLNLYRELVQEKGEGEVLRILNAGSRDQGRGVMIWNEHKYAGFSEKQPWIWSQEQPVVASVEEQKKDQNSVFVFYQDLLHFRKDNDTLIYGDTYFYGKHKKNIFAYRRADQSQSFYIHCNLSKQEQIFKTYYPVKTLLFSNYETLKADRMKPYEVRVYDCE